VATGEADEAADLFGECLAGERGSGVFFAGHGGGASSIWPARLDCRGISTRVIIVRASRDDWGCRKR
jgi:hypothetical protein